MNVRYSPGNALYWPRTVRPSAWVIAIVPSSLREALRCYVGDGNPTTQSISLDLL
jgi:hypothetical protein